MFTLILFLNITYYNHIHSENNFNFFVDKKYENKLYTNFFSEINLEDFVETNYDEIQKKDNHKKVFYQENNIIQQPLGFTPENKIKYVASYKN